MQPNQQVAFLTDGGEDIRDLPRYLNPQAEHLLDWFHLTMRITVLTQLAKGPRCAGTDPAVSAAQLIGNTLPVYHPGDAIRLLRCGMGSRAGGRFRRLGIRVGRTDHARE